MVSKSKCAIALNQTCHRIEPGMLHTLTIGELGTTVFVNYCTQDYKQ